MQGAQVQSLSLVEELKSHMPKIHKTHEPQLLSPHALENYTTMKDPECHNKGPADFITTKISFLTKLSYSQRPPS